MKAIAVVCPACDAAWRGRRARFCGRCGTLLRAATRPARRSRRWLPALVGAAGLVGLGLLAAMVALTDPAPPPGAAGSEDDGIELPAEPEHTQPTPLTEREALTLALQGDVDRLRCAPDGCEAWHTVLPAGTPVAHAGDLVVLVEGGEVVGLDAASGARRWSRPVRPLAGAPLDNPPDPDLFRLVSDEQAVLVVAGSRLVLVDLDGHVHWDQRVRGQFLSVRPGVEVVLATASTEAWGRHEVVVAIDRDHGGVRWQREVHTTHVLDPDLAVVATVTGHLEAVEPSGEIRWTHRASPTASVERDGDHLRVVTAGRSVVLDVATGEVLRESSGGTQQASTATAEVDPATGERLGRAVIGSTSGPASRRALAARSGAWLDLGGMHVRWDGDGVTLRQGDARVRVDGRDLHIASTDPVVVRGGDELLGVRFPDDGG